MVAELFRAIGNPVIGYDLFPDKEWAENKNVELKSFVEVVSQADILSLHIPANIDKTPVIGSKEINQMKSNAFLINLARGGVVDEKALYQSLKLNKIAGTAIDVFSSEPYNGPLCELDNVVLTPHLGSYAIEGKLQMEIDAVNNLITELKKL